jgi:hypothetical protein
MRLALLVLTLAIGMRAQNLEIAVELKDAELVPPDILMQAQLTASRIYVGIGVKLKWSSDDATDLRVQFDAGMTAAFHSGALGYAAPYGGRGTVVHVLFDRVSQVSSAGQMGVLLGHVIAHELGHILKGTDGHADRGIMKAQWSARDLAQMTFRPLSFTREDAELIREGIPARKHTGTNRRVVTRKPVGGLQPLSQALGFADFYFPFASAQRMSQRNTAAVQV